MTHELNKYDTLVLSGAGVKGIAFLGSLQYVYDNNMLTNTTNYVGTSAGSIICYLLIIGYTPIEIMVYVCTTQLLNNIQTYNLVDIAHGKGMCAFSSVHEHLEKMTIDKIGYLPTMNDLHVKFNKHAVFTTYNLTLEKVEYLSYKNYPDLPCITAVRMSSNLPIVFEKFKYGDSFYIDGGISDNFPIDMGERIGDKILGIYSSGPMSVGVDDMNTLDYIYKLLFIPISQSIEKKVDESTEKSTLIELKSDIKLFTFDINSSEKLDMFSYGYKHIKDHLNDVIN